MGHIYHTAPRRLWSSSSCMLLLFSTSLARFTHDPHTSRALETMNGTLSTALEVHVLYCTVFQWVGIELILWYKSVVAQLHQSELFGQPYNYTWDNLMFWCRCNCATTITCISVQGVAYIHLIFTTTKESFVCTLQSRKSLSCKRNSVSMNTQLWQHTFFPHPIWDTCTHRSCPVHTDPILRMQFCWLSEWDPPNHCVWTGTTNSLK